jgi:hypothetical protein
VQNVHAAEWSRLGITVMQRKLLASAQTHRLKHIYQLAVPEGPDLLGSKTAVQVFPRTVVGPAVALQGFRRLCIQRVQFPIPLNVVLGPYTPPTLQHLMRGDFYSTPHLMQGPPISDLLSKKCLIPYAPGVAAQASRRSMCNPHLQAHRGSIEAAGTPGHQVIRVCLGLALTRTHLVTIHRKLRFSDLQSWEE